MLSHKLKLVAAVLFTVASVMVGVATVGNSQDTSQIADNGRPPPPPIQPQGGGSGSGVAVSGFGVTGPGKIVNADDVGLSHYPDNPLQVVPPEALTVKFVAEHRSALNDKHVIVHGIVINVRKGGCPSNPMMGMPCSASYIIIADTLSPDRDKNYDMMVFLPSEDTSAYQTGRDVKISGTISGNQSGASIKKD